MGTMFSPHVASHNHMELQCFLLASVGTFIHMAYMLTSTCIHIKYMLAYIFLKILESLDTQDLKMGQWWADAKGGRARIVSKGWSTGAKLKLNRCEVFSARSHTKGTTDHNYIV